MEGPGPVMSAGAGPVLQRESRRSYQAEGLTHSHKEPGSLGARVSRSPEVGGERGERRLVGEVL